MVHPAARLLGAALLLLAASPPARAAEITVAWAAAPSSADPHFHQVTPNTALARHVFGSLVRTDPKLRMEPDLAASWRLLDARSWEFRLVDTTFHDGTPLTANDVVYSLCRALRGVGPTQSFTQAPKTLASIEIPDPRTVILRTRLPDPTLPALLVGHSIVSARSAGAGTVTFDPATGCGDLPSVPSSEFDGGRMANGTGPYRLARYVSGDMFVLEANPRHFRGRPHWDRVTVRPVSKTGARVAGLLAGDFDLIENPASQDLPALKARGGFAWSVVPSDRIMYLQPDIGRSPSPMVQAPDGRNPLADARVREAISLAIDRRAIAERLMDGLAVPADQYVTEGLPGHLDNPPARGFDPARARRLLAEAGYPDGFALTVSSTNDRYVNDAQVTQAIGQFLTRIGIRTRVDAMTQTTFFPRRAKREFSLALGGWGYGPTAAISLLRTWMVTTDRERGLGGSNYGAWSDPAFDAAFLPALEEMDEAKRAGLLDRAVRIALEANALIPLYWETSVWAFKDRYRYQGRSDQITDVDGLSVKAP